MPAVVLSPILNGWQGLTLGGLPLSGGLVNTYQAGTSTPQATYTTNLGNVANANPIVLGQDGRPPQEIWLVQGQAYRFTVTDSLSNLIATYDNITAIGDLSTLADTTNAANGDALIGVKLIATGSTARTQHDKNADFINVLDFGAKGDGSTDDQAALNAASTFASSTGRALYFPTPASYYKVTQPISAHGSSHWIGENGASTIIRNTAGGTAITCDGTGSLGPYVFEHLRIGGSGGIGLTVTGGGFAQYVAQLEMRYCHFESDLATCVSANMIFHKAWNCSFGYYTQSATNGSHAHYVLTGGAGGLNANMNQWFNCRFYNSLASFGSIIQSGFPCEFNQCDWEANVRNLKTNNITGVRMIACYTERSTGGNNSGLFEFDNSRTQVVINGGHYDGQLMVGGCAMFSIDSTSRAIIESADISTSATGFTYYNNSAPSNIPPSSGIHHFKDNRLQGNGSDPLVWLDNILEGVANAWTPSPTNLTVVNGTGGASYSGEYTIINRTCFFTIKIAVTGTCTTAATVNSTFFAPIPNLPFPIQSSSLSVTEEAPTSGTSLGVGLVYSPNGRFYMPGWVARNSTLIISGTFAF